MIVSIHQPQYLPWLGIIDKIARSDLFILLDTVQFGRHGFQHRTLYSTERGQAYLSLAVRSKNHIGSHQTIAATKLANPGITRKHAKTLKQRYGRCRGWEKFGAAVQALLEREWDNMCDLNQATLELTLAAFGIETKLIRASALRAGGHKTDLVVALAAEVGARRYLSGRGAQAYLDCTKFAAAGIDVVYQDFVHPQYVQSHGGAFVPGCFALEWMLEESDEARAKFTAHLDAHHPVAVDICGCERSDRPAGR